MANPCRIANWCLWFTFVAVLVGSEAGFLVGQESATRSRGVLGEGTAWETPWFVTDSGVDGPTVLVVGGIHGNEPAGYHAADQIRTWPINAGKLIVIPQVNRLGLKANTRWIPQFRNDRQARDLNRNFPTADRPAAQTELAIAIWKFAEGQHPDWVFDLHEGFDFHSVNSKSVGSSVIAFSDDAAFGQLLVDRINRDRSQDPKFDLLAGSGPVAGSLAKACKVRLGARSFIVETTFKNQPISTRTRQHRRILATAFQRIGMTDIDCTDLMVVTDRKTKSKVAVFDGPGADSRKIVSVLRRDPSIAVTHVGPGDLREGVLKQFDVIVFPGGSGGKQGRAIGEERRQLIRDFVHDGGGVLGICAGAYLCSSHYAWSLDLMNASVFNKMVDVPGKGKKSMWYRGSSVDVDVEITNVGEEIIGLSGIQSVRYHNGPIVSPGDKAGVPPYIVLATFRSENGIYEAQKSTMIGTPAILSADYGEGRVLAISPHFESTRGLESVVTRAVEYLVGAKNTE